MSLAGSTTQPAPAWEELGTDPLALAEVLMPVLPRLKQVSCWPEPSSGRHGPPTVSQLRAVAYLAEHDAVSLRQLASAMRLSAPATSELVDRLVERDAVTRQPNPRDRRQVVIAITPKARAIWARLREERLQRLARVIARLDPDQRQGFVRGMMLLADEVASAHASDYPNPGTQSRCS